jgi:hypothetical protein
MIIIANAARTETEDARGRWRELINIFKVSFLATKARCASVEMRVREIPPGQLPEHVE